MASTLSVIDGTIVTAPPCFCGDTVWAERDISLSELWGERADFFFMVNFIFSNKSQMLDMIIKNASSHPER